jgi:hypothetical protein
MQPGEAERLTRRAYLTARAMKADMPEHAREEFGRKLDDYGRALHREIAAQLAEFARSEGG